MPTTNTGDRKITGNHFEVVFDDRFKALEVECAALSAQINFLLEVIDSSGAYKVCQDLCDARHKTPQQCLRDVKAEAGRVGYVNGYRDGHNDQAYGLFNQNEYADQYAATLRQGGAE